MTRRVVPPPVPALVVGQVRHTRQTPVQTAFTHRQHQWLVDLDDLPTLPGPLRPLARFEARDHFDGGSADGTIRGDLARFLTRRGVQLDHADRVLMLVHARSLGHVFNPLSVYWCLRPDGTLAAVVLEVHNTYGERHAYLLDGERGRTEKSFYVSPFNDVSGHYEVAVRLRPERISTSVTLIRDGRTVLVADTIGTPQPATPARVVRLVARYGPMTRRVALLIRAHGIALWLRRLPIRPRPAADPEGVR